MYLQLLKSHTTLSHETQTLLTGIRQHQFPQIGAPSAQHFKPSVNQIRSQHTILTDQTIIISQLRIKMNRNKLMRKQNPRAPNTLKRSRDEVNLSQIRKSTSQLPRIEKFPIQKSD
uniref:Uncharacterized protein n=1 Tax=Opuntia streptacantha TaxID=393608 RepID=A0A7C8YP55_OPUST